MNTPIIIIAIILVALIAIYKFIATQRAAKNINKKGIQSKDSEIEVIKPRKPTPPRRLTLEESWRFLTEITELVMFKFSRKDQQVTLELGKIMAQTGMIYQHVIEYGIRTLDRKRSVSETKNIDQLPTKEKLESKGSAR